MFQGSHCVIDRSTARQEFVRSLSRKKVIGCLLFTLTGSRLTLPAPLEGASTMVKPSDIHFSNRA